MRSYEAGGGPSEMFQASSSWLDGPKERVDEEYKYEKLGMWLGITFKEVEAPGNRGYRGHSHCSGGQKERVQEWEVR
jgi:hypothetical protein